MTWRRLGVLVEALPGESATKTAIRDGLGDEELSKAAGQEPDGHGPWSRTDLQLAAIGDLLKWVIYATYAAQGGKPRQPEPTPRPGIARKRKRISAEGYAHLQRLREEHARLHGYEIDGNGFPIQDAGTG